MPPLDTNRLRQRPIALVGHAPRRWAGPIRTTMILAITLGSVAAGAATLHRVGWSSGFLSLERSPAAPAPPQAVRSRSSDHAAVAPAPEAPPAIPLGQAPTWQAAGGSEPGQRTASVRAAPASPSAHSRPTAASRTTAKESSPTEPPHPPAEAVDDESALIVGAVRALRRDGDPGRAQALAEEALQRYPRGVQVEEAMALAMEAASARGDAAGARRAAQRYLENFLRGRFADRADRILAAPLR